MSLPTASKIGRVLACPASHVLPQSPPVDSPHADAGRLRHAALAEYVQTGSTDNLAPEVEAWLDGVRAAAAELDGCETEVALGYDAAWAEGRIIGHNLGRSYSPRPSEYAGAADYLRADEHGLWIVDLKTGRGEVEPPERNAQLLTLAVAARRAFSVSGPVTLSLLLAPDGAEPRWRTAEVSADELDAHEHALAVLIGRLESASADAAKHVQRGPHCKYCPARAACPAWGAAADAMVARPANQLPAWRAMLEQGRAGELYAAWRQARETLAEIGEALHAHAASQPIALADGSVFARKTVQRTTIDAAQAWSLLSSAYGTDVARSAMTLEASKASIGRAAEILCRERKATGAKASKKAITDELMASIGPAVSTTVVERFGEYKSGAAAEIGSGDVDPDAGA